MELLEHEARDILVSEWRHKDLFGGSAAEPAPELGSAWKFQHENAKFIHRQQQIAREFQVEIHQSDEHAIQATVSPTTLQRFPDIRAAFGSVVVKPSTERAMAAVVLVVQRSHANDDAMAWLENQVMAHRQLVLSPYFQHFLGRKEIPSPAQHLYCFEHMSVRKHHALSLC